MKNKTKLNLVVVFASLLLLSTFVMATTYIVSLYDEPQMAGEIFEVDDVSFMKQDGNIYVNLQMSWWKLDPSTYTLHPTTPLEMVQLMTDINCEIIESEQICLTGGSGSGGGPN